MTEDSPRQGSIGFRAGEPRVQVEGMDDASDWHRPAAVQQPAPPSS